ncbi:MAG: aquaporin family protein [Pirellulales bacterium]|nr:aquaporin family protein [Pirellulales bacterium]
MANTSPTLPRKIGAEIVGTFLLVFLGCGAVHSAVLTDSLTGLFQVGIVWGVAIMMAVFTVGRISGAHINPAITLGMATWRMMKWREVPGYVFGQMLGAFLAAAALFVIFHDDLMAKEADKGVSRGEDKSIITAMCYGEYFPNPSGMAGQKGPLTDEQFQAWSDRRNHLAAFLAELLGTAILGFVVVGVTDAKNSGSPGQMAPAIIGMTVAVLICVLAPITQACFNPARDYGPRLFAYVGGWKEAAIPGPNGIGMVTVYLVAPILGAICGMGLYHGLTWQKAE